MKRFLGRAFFAIVLIAVVAAAALDFTFAIKRWMQFRNDDAPLTTATGIVIDERRLAFPEDLTLGRGDKRYRVRYRFAAGEKNVESTDLITASHGFRPGEQVPISYRKSDPATNRIVVNRETGDIIFRAGIGLLILAALLFVLFILAYTKLSFWRAKRALAKDGVLERAATITQIDRDGSEAVVHFTFVDGHGTQRRASDEVDADDVAKLNAGDTGKVYWDPEYPDEADWIG